MAEPLHRQVADDLDHKIESGQYPPGTQLPSYRALQEQYGIAKSTVAEAMAVLQARGRIVVRPKSRAVVRGPEPRQRLIVSGTVRRNELGYLFSDPVGHWVPLGAPTREYVACPEEVAEHLGVPVGERVLARRRVGGISAKEPMQITTTYLHPLLIERVPVVAERDTGPGGWLDRLEEHPEYGGPVRVFSTAYARVPTEQEALDLRMPVSTPVLVEARRVYQAGADHEVDPPVAVDLVIRDAKSWELRREMVRGESATWPVEPATARNVPRSHT